MSDLQTLIDALNDIIDLATGESAFEPDDAQFADIARDALQKIGRSR